METPDKRVLTRVFRIFSRRPCSKLTNTRNYTEIALFGSLNNLTLYLCYCDFVIESRRITYEYVRKQNRPKKAITVLSVGHNVPKASRADTINN